MSLKLNKKKERVMKQNSNKPLPPPVSSIKQKLGVKLRDIYILISSNPNNWDEQLRYS